MWLYADHLTFLGFADRRRFPGRVGRLCLFPLPLHTFLGEVPAELLGVHPARVYNVTAWGEPLPFDSIECDARLRNLGSDRTVSKSTLQAGKAQPALPAPPPLTKMLANGTRSCDICYREIKKGEKYAAYMVEKSEAPWSITEQPVDAQGDVQVDVCLDCRMITGMSGAEIVN